MPQLTDIEKLLTEKQLIFKWLCEGRISCRDLIDEYTKVIEDERNDAIYEATSYTYPLYLMQEKAKLSKKNEWIRDKAIGMLYTFDNKRNGIAMRKAFEDYVKEHKLNTKKGTIQYQIYEE